MAVNNFEETRAKFPARKQTQSLSISNETIVSETNSLSWFKMLKVSRLMVTSLKILVTSNQFSVTLATGWSRFRTLLNLFS